jgi:hypothetical protein
MVQYSSCRIYLEKSMRNLDRDIVNVMSEKASASFARMNGSEFFDGSEVCNDHGDIGRRNIKPRIAFYWYEFTSRFCRCKGDPSFVSRIKISVRREVEFRRRYSEDST